MIIAYAVILTGGLVITARLHLLAMAATFWGSLAVGVGVIAATGHCMTARWAFAPGVRVRLLAGDRHVARGADLPLLHDHRPQDRAGRAARAVAFGVLVAVASTLVMATQTSEYGTKVALLGGLVVVWLAPAARTAPPGVGAREGDGPAARRTRAVARRRGRRRRRAPVRRRPRRGRVAGRRPRRGAGRRCRRPCPPRHRPGDVPGHHRRAGRGRLEPRDRRRPGPGARARPRREPRAGEPGPVAPGRHDPARGRPRRPARGDAGPARRRRGRRASRRSSATRSRPSTCGCSSRSEPRAGSASGSTHGARS